jgi:hypothetical protein
MTFANPYDSLTVLNVQVKWNATQGQNTWTLQSATLGSLFWTGTNTSGNYTITPASTLTIPGNNTISSIIFTFDSNYTKKNTDSITINLSGSCAGFQITSP